MDISQDFVDSGEFLTVKCMLEEPEYPWYHAQR